MDMNSVNNGGYEQNCKAAVSVVVLRQPET